MDIAIVLSVSLVLAVATIALAMSHNWPFDWIFDRSARRWWLRQFGINNEQRK